MISGMVTHTGEPKLAWHLLRSDHNESVDVRIHGLWSTTLTSALRELRGMSVDARTTKPLVHVWSSPSIQYDPDQWEEHWYRFETEFDLVGQPYVEVAHLKFSHGGRTARHIHRVYLRIEPEGLVTPIRWSAARLEKLSRISEFVAGEPFTSGSFNQSVIGHLHAEGYDAVADAMTAAGLHMHRAGSTCSAAERAAAERSGDVAPDEWKRRIFLVLNSGKSGRELVNAFAGIGMRLATGDKAVVAVTPAGNRIPVLRGYNQIARARGGQTMKKAELDRRVGDVELPLASCLGPMPEFTEFGSTHVGAARREVGQCGAQEGQVDLQSTVIVADRSSRPDVDLGGNPVPVDPLIMTPSQSQALQNWLDIMFASSPPEAIPEQPSRSVQNDKRRLAGERGHLKQPALEHPDWRDAYRAKLAGVPRELGPRLAWVEQRERDRVRIKMKSGSVVSSEPGRVSTSEPTMDTPEVMVQRALAIGIKQAVVRGGSPEWREAIARRATKAGIRIDSADLVGIVVDETERVETRKLCAVWKKAHVELRSDAPASAPPFIEAVLALSERARLDEILSPEELSLFKEHLSKVRSFRQRHGAVTRADMDSGRNR